MSTIPNQYFNQMIDSNIIHAAYDRFRTPLNAKPTYPPLSVWRKSRLQNSLATKMSVWSIQSSHGPARNVYSDFACISLLLLTSRRDEIGSFLHTYAVIKMFAFFLAIFQC